MLIELNPIKIKDALKISEWKSNKKLSQLIMSKYSVTTIEQAEDWIIKNSTDRNQKLLGIYYSEELIGITRLMFIDYVCEHAELGIYVGSDKYRGRGIGKKSMKLLLDIAFRELKLNKVFLKVRGDNTIAINLYKNIGFKIEGVLREHFFDEGKFKSIIMMAIFRNEFLDE